MNFLKARFACENPKFTGNEFDCATCNGMLARGDFSEDVPEIRYDRCGTNADGCGGRYAGLLPHEAQALHEAVDALITLRIVWATRNDAANALEDEADDVPTVVDSGMFYDFLRGPARNYNEDGDR